MNGEKLMGKREDDDRDKAHGLLQDGMLDASEAQRTTCFVIQPFDKDTFDARYTDTFKPALAQAGFEAYRVDEDPKTEVLIQSIENGIRKAHICLADVTTDNPNVWYELGFAYAAGKRIILTCCDEEREGALPFDIRHRSVIQYKSKSLSDFEVLKEKIIERASVLRGGAIEKQIVEANPIAPQGGLLQIEIQLLGLIASETATPGEGQSVWSLSADAKSLGLTNIAIGLAFRSLIARGFVDVGEENDDFGHVYNSASVTDEGWTWIKGHASLFNLTGRTEEEEDFDDEYGTPL